MAPEIKISEGQSKKIQEWIHSKSRRGPREWEWSGEIRLVMAEDSTSNSLGVVWNVGDEPIVIYTKDNSTSEFNLLCSENHAKALEEAGIVNFSETPESTR